MVYIPVTVMDALLKLKKMQEEMKQVFGDEYADYGMVICQSNGRPVMTEHLNKRFSQVLQELGLKKVVFHSLRASSTTYKLRVSNGD